MQPRADAENVLRVASGLASGNASYDYWADGARRSKTYASVTSTFYYTGDQEIAEYSGATLTRRYVRLPGSVDEPLLMIDYTLDAACTNTAYATCEVWAHQNRLGSVVATTDSTGAPIEKYTYSSYGVSDDATGFPFRFTGQKLDAETGLYYYKARYYDSEVGRFLQTDPIGYEDQMNLYAYVGNDPVNGFDPTGTECTNSDDGTTNCVTDDYDVTFDTPEGFQNTDPDADDYHQYEKSARSDLNEQDTRDWVRENPTPGTTNPATPGAGSTNDATPVIGGLPGNISPVKSITTTNKVTGREVVINVTLPGHPLDNGIVVREVVPNADGTSTIITRGEGNGALQAPGSPYAGPINNVWRFHAPTSAAGRGQRQYDYCTRHPAAC